MLLESLLSKLAAAGLATKAAAGGTAVVLAASAAGAAGALPGQAQDAFDGLVSVEDTAEAEAVAVVAEDDDGVTDDATEASEDVDTDEGATSEDVDTDEEYANFGERVSADATGESDGEPGVDGQEISAEARAMHDDEGDDAAPEDVDTDDADDADDDADDDDADDDDADDDDADDDDNDDDDGPEGTPGEDAVDANRPGDDG